MQGPLRDTQLLELMVQGFEIVKERVAHRAGMLSAAQLLKRLAEESL